MKIILDEESGESSRFLCLTGWQMGSDGADLLVWSAVKGQHGPEPKILAENKDWSGRVLQSTPLWRCSRSFDSTPGANDRMRGRTVVVSGGEDEGHQARWRCCHDADGASQQGEALIKDPFTKQSPSLIKCYPPFLSASWSLSLHHPSSFAQGLRLNLCTSKRWGGKHDATVLINDRHFRGGVSHHGKAQIFKFTAEKWKQILYLASDLCTDLSEDVKLIKDDLQRHA